MFRVFCIIVIPLCLLILHPGCDYSSPDLSQVDDDLPERSLTGQEILDAVIDQYKNTESYSDKTVLYLTYRLGGKPIKEPHPWSVTFNRSGQIAADLFNAKIRKDGKRLSCYVFDIESGNIDNQHVLVDDKSFSYLLNDEIAKHFLFGTSELPLDELETLKENKLIPPMLGFFESDLFPTWLSEPDSINRLPDDSSLGVDCYVIELCSDDRTHLIWVEKQSGQIEKIQLPLQYLDSQILASEEVSDIRFFARYHDVSFERLTDPKTFQIPERVAAKAVSKFVTLPEPLPCERLGNKVAEFNLYHQDGTRFLVDPKKDTTVLLWAPAFNALQLIENFGGLAGKSEFADANFAVVLSDELVQASGNMKWSPEKKIETALNSSSVLPLLDAQLEFVDSLGIKSVPVLAVFDKTNVIQYVQPIDEEDWLETATVGISRVIAGDAVAIEMQREYQVFLDQYHKQVAAQASHSFTKSSKELVGGSKKLNSKTIWINDELTNPNLIHVESESNRLFVLDGLQSIGEYNMVGELVQRKRLPIPEQTAINRLASIVDAQKQIYFVAYSLLGKEAFVFNDKWELIFDFDVSSSTDLNQITNCQLVLDNGQVSLMISGLGPNGLLITDASGRIDRIGKGPCRSFLSTGETLFKVNGLGQLSINSNAIEELNDWKFYLLKECGDSDKCFAMAKNARGYWQLFALDSAGVVWAKGVNPLENGLNELFVSGISGEDSYAVFANIENMIELFGHEMEFWTETKLVNPVHGMALIQENGSRFICVSDGRIVKMLKYSLNSQSIQRVSTDRSQ